MATKWPSSCHLHSTSIAKAVKVDRKIDNHDKDVSPCKIEVLIGNSLKVVA